MQALACCAAFAGWTASAQEPAYSDARAQELIQVHCTRCHATPNPVELPKEYWPLALHWMSHYAGYKGDEFPDIHCVKLRREQQLFGDYANLYTVSDSAGRTKYEQIFSAFELKLDQPPLSPADWAVLRQYFVARAAPMNTMWIKRDKQPVLQKFTPKYPQLGLPPNSLILSALVDERRGRLYVGKNDTQLLTQGGHGGGSVIAYDLKTEKEIASIPVLTDTRDMELTPTGLRISLHGTHPVIAKDPKGQVIDWELDGKRSRVRMLANGFSRITQMHTQDLNGDGLQDIVVTGFGDGMLTVGGGRFSILWQTPEYARMYANAPAEIPQGPLPGAFKETVLMDRAGMIGTAIADFNADGRPDILLLTAQAQQQVILYVNQGNGQFEQRVLMEHGPSYGHVTLDVGDFNNDGRPDFLIVNGNNVEMVVPRPHHGLRLYQNNGNLTFSERYYYPMHGATRAALADFDRDGDLDIAAIALWPDWQLSEPETFVYLENKGDWQFTPASLDTSHWGLWTHITAGDVNGDQWPDIVLGLGNFREFVAPDWANHPIMKSRKGEAQSVLYLLNKN